MLREEGVKKITAVHTDGWQPETTRAERHVWRSSNMTTDSIDKVTRYSILPECIRERETETETETESVDDVTAWSGSS